MKYQCKICKYIYDEVKEEYPFSSLNDDYICPMCYGPKLMFAPWQEQEIIKSTRIYEHAVKVSLNNPGIVRDDSKCIDCGICKQTCHTKCGLIFNENSDECLSCGQCILTCPTNALKPRSAITKIKEELASGKKGICYTSPATRVSIGEIFGYPEGSFLQGKLIALLRSLGFTYVFDTTFGADLTVMEEATELVDRLTNGGVLPMFSSCCPAWIKYCETKYPEFIPNLSSCKSPIAMQGAITKDYFLPKENLLEDEIFTVAITPCTAKKMEIMKDDIYGTDYVLTIQELGEWALEEKIDFQSLIDDVYDSLFSEGSGSGVIFGNTGGVTEATLRTVHYLLTNEEAKELITLKTVHGLEKIKEATLVINQIPIHVAVVHQISVLPKLLEKIKNGECNYHFIEVMNCAGGCIGGGGQPKLDSLKEKEGKQKELIACIKRNKKILLKIVIKILI